MIRRVILVEDDPDDTDLFTTFLGGREDITALPVVGNGKELIEFLTTRAERELPDLIILDQNMPMMNGKQTLQFLQSHTRFSRIAAVIYSTYTDSTLIIECTKLGARMVAVKPIDQEGYDKMLDDFLQVV